MLVDLSRGDLSRIRESTPQSNVWWLSGDHRLLSSRSGTPITLTLAQHSGRGKRGGSYVAANSGGSTSEFDIDALIARFS